LIIFIVIKNLNESMVRIRVNSPQNVAAESQRNIEEEVEVDLNDKIPDVKVKITLVYT
jgi:hypothetical protein